MPRYTALPGHTPPIEPEVEESEPTSVTFGMKLTLVAGVFAFSSSFMTCCGFGVLALFAPALLGFSAVSVIFGIKELARIKADQRKQESKSMIYWGLGFSAAAILVSCSILGLTWGSGFFQTIH